MAISFWVDFCTISHKYVCVNGFFCEMVQKEQKRRGRPRAYVPELALSKAIKAFWPAGFAGTSLDELAAATGMNRPASTARSATSMTST
jgi:hypothetical protein